jgi:hypothetical protein
VVVVQRKGPGPQIRFGDEVSQGKALVIACRDNEALLRPLAERLRKVPGVTSAETFVYLRIVKQSYHWGSP